MYKLKSEKRQKKKRNIATANHDTEIMQNELAKNKLRKMHFKLNIHNVVRTNTHSAQSRFSVCVRARNLDTRLNEQ